MTDDGPVDGLAETTSTTRRTTTTVAGSAAAAPASEPADDGPDLFLAIAAAMAVTGALALIAWRRS